MVIGLSRGHHDLFPIIQSTQTQLLYLLYDRYCCTVFVYVLDLKSNKITMRIYVNVVVNQA